MFQTDQYNSTYPLYPTGVMPFPSCPVYTATKHGVMGFTRAMAVSKVYLPKSTEAAAWLCVCLNLWLCVFPQDLSTASGYGIRFNAVCPGFVQTGLLTDTMQNLGKFSHMADKIKEGMELYGVIEWVFSEKSKLFIG